VVARLKDFGKILLMIAYATRLPKDAKMRAVQKS